MSADSLNGAASAFRARPLGTDGLRVSTGSGEQWGGGQNRAESSIAESQNWTASAETRWRCRCGRAELAYY